MVTIERPKIKSGLTTLYCPQKADTFKNYNPQFNDGRSIILFYRYDSTLRSVIIRTGGQTKQKIPWVNGDYEILLDLTGYSFQKKISQFWSVIRRNGIPLEGFSRLFFMELAVLTRSRKFNPACLQLLIKRNLDHPI